MNCKIIRPSLNTPPPQWALPRRHLPNKNCLSILGIALLDQIRFLNLIVRAYHLKASGFHSNLVFINNVRLSCIHRNSNIYHQRSKTKGKRPTKNRKKSAEIVTGLMNSLEKLFLLRTQQLSLSQFYPFQVISLTLYAPLKIHFPLTIQGFIFAALWQTIQTGSRQ